MTTRFERVVGRRLVKSFGRTVALRGVNVEIAAGRLTAIEGANGSGKSTLLGILGGVIRPTSGEVSFEPEVESQAARRGLIGWLSHEALGYPDLSGRQNVELVARLHGLDAARIWSRAEERFELGAFARRPLRGCSRGQKQRIALARALVHEPMLILLDEPTTGLDRSGVERLQRIAAEEVVRGAAVCVVTHDKGLFGAGTARVTLSQGRVLG